MPKKCTMYREKIRKYIKNKENPKNKYEYEKPMHTMKIDKKTQKRGKT